MVCTMDGCAEGWCKESTYDRILKFADIQIKKILLNWVSTRSTSDTGVIPEKHR